MSRVASDLRSVGVPRRSRTCTSLLVRALVSFASVVFAMLASLNLFPPQSARVDPIDESAIRARRRQRFNRIVARLGGQFQLAGSLRRRASTLETVEKFRFEFKPKEIKGSGLDFLRARAGRLPR